MESTIILQAIINGLLIGGIYSLAAVGLTLVFGVLKIINFAHGEFLMLGMYFSYYAFTWIGASPYVSAFICIPFFAAFGAAIQTGIITRVMKAPEDIQILLTVGLAIFLQNAALLFFHPTIRAISRKPSISVLSFGNIVISSPRLVACLVALGMSFILYLFLKYTEFGKTIRACAEEEESASLVGINVGQIHAITFGIGIACAAIAGALIMPFFPLSPFTGTVFTLTGFVVVVLGGMGDFRGALMAGIVIGVFESIGAIFIPASLKQVVSFGIFILILLFRPSGLLGRKHEWLTI
jgi:branched-chain amino acid transport system permease protein